MTIKLDLSKLMPGAFAVPDAKGNEVAFLVSVPHEEGGWCAASPEELDLLTAYLNERQESGRSTRPRPTLTDPSRQI